MTPFIKEMLKQKPIFTETLGHRKFKFCLDQVTALGRLLPQATIILIVGPSNAGKSLLLACLADFLSREIFVDRGDGKIPVIGATAQISRETRTAPKYLYSKLLADIGSPLFDPSKIEQIRYSPSINHNETYLLTTLQNGIAVCGTRVVLVDEGNFLVRTKNEEFRSSLIESLKSLVMVDTTLCLCGGYEMAEAIFSRAHLAARKVVCHLEGYSDSVEDRLEWRSILASITESPKIRLAEKTLLQEHSDKLLWESHGVIGILERRLLRAVSLSVAEGSPITRDILEATAPSLREWKTIGNDIENGKKLLAAVGELAPAQTPSVSKSPSPKGRPGSRKRFDRRPRRAIPTIA
ncbi:AAA family ATPase [Luteibacter sp. Lutesp34]|uniref:AAA family ATPase n=1 Tax=Luteibacter sp. Lutesp34 TaxID=3243030 RepID=UPI0039B3F2FD